MRRFVATIVTIVAFAAPVVLAATPASAAKAGQLCKAADEGKSLDGVKCTKDGTRFRWTGGPVVTTKAPATTKTPATTKAPAKTATTKAKKTAKATTDTNATTNTKATGTTKKSSSTPASTGGGVAVKGRFCAKADDGRKETDAKGRKLTCKADAAGKNRWQE